MVVRGGNERSHAVRRAVLRMCDLAYAECREELDEIFEVWLVRFRCGTLAKSEVWDQDRHPVNASLNKHSGRVTAEG